MPYGLILTQVERKFFIRQISKITKIYALYLGTTIGTRMELCNNMPLNEVNTIFVLRIFNRVGNKGIFKQCKFSGTNVLRKDVALQMLK